MHPFRLWGTLLLVCWAVVVPIRAAENEDALLELAATVEQAVLAADADAFAARLDVKLLAERITLGVLAKPTFRDEFIAGFAQRGGGHFMENILKGIGDMGSYKFLRIVERDGETRLLFRMQGDRGLNYHELITAPSTNGALKIIDIYVFMSGESISDTVRSLYIRAAMQAERGAKIMPPGFDKMLELRRLLQEGQAQQAVDLYQRLPPALQREKIVQIIYIQAALNVSDELYLAALEQFHQDFADDPTADLISLDLYLMRGQYDEAMEAVDRIDAAAGGDSFLHVHRGMVHLNAGDLEAAKASALRALESEPDLLAAHDLLLTTSLTA